jgi:glutamate carboxypeptidase
MRYHLAPTILLLLLSLSTRAGVLSDDEQAISDWVDQHQEQAIALLEETVNIGSGTMNHEGVRAVGDVMARELSALNLDVRWIDMPESVNRAGHLFAKKDGAGAKLLLIGHLDTVFEADDEFQAFNRIGNTAEGPGISDMKSGNAVIIYALKALAHIHALKNMAITVAYTGDEEKPGRPLNIARKDLLEAGQWADIALGFEGAITTEGDDWATIARRSSSSWMLQIKGRQAHSSVIFSEDVGAGAINEAARILNAFYTQVRGEYGLTFNAGNIQGGTAVTYEAATNKGTAFGKTNVVPSYTTVHGGIRALSVEQLKNAKQHMQAIVATHLPHTEATLSFDDGYPPMAPTEGNKTLALALSKVNEDLGRGVMKTWDPLRRGAADIAFVAPYTDALAGLGALGKGGHTPNESLQLDSMALAIKRAAILMLRLSKDSRDKSGQ